MHRADIRGGEEAQEEERAADESSADGSSSALVSNRGSPRLNEEASLSSPEGVCVDVWAQYPGLLSLLAKRERSA